MTDVSKWQMSSLPAGQVVSDKTGQTSAVESGQIEAVRQDGKLS